MGTGDKRNLLNIVFDALGLTEEEKKKFIGQKLNW
jgi:hypothetical protein